MDLEELYLEEIMDTMDLLDEIDEIEEELEEELEEEESEELQDFIDELKEAEEEFLTLQEEIEEEEEEYMEVLEDLLENTNEETLNEEDVGILQDLADYFGVEDYEISLSELEEEDDEQVIEDLDNFWMGMEENRYREILIEKFKKIFYNIYRK